MANKALGLICRSVKSRSPKVISKLYIFGTGQIAFRFRCTVWFLTLYDGYRIIRISARENV